MICPVCGHDVSKVIDSRCSKGITRRRRACKVCSARYTTYELTSDALEQMSQSGGVSKVIDEVFGFLDVIQDIARKRLSEVRAQLPSSYVKLKPARAEEKQVTE